MKIVEILKEGAKEVKDFLHSQIEKSTYSVRNLKEIEVDLHRRTDNIIIEVLKKNSIPCVVLNDTSTMYGPICEEIRIGDDRPEYIVMVDSIDGSINFVKGFRNYSLALSVAGYDKNVKYKNIEYSLILNLVTGDVIESYRNHGTYLNGRRVNSPRDSTLEGAIVSIDLNFRGQNPEIFVKRMSEIILRLIDRHARIRMIGTNSLEASMVSYGAVDLFMDLRDLFQAPDIAPSYLIVKEAGGSVVNGFGHDFSEIELLSSAKHSVIYAANERILKEILDVMNIEPTTS